MRKRVGVPRTRSSFDYASWSVQDVRTRGGYYVLVQTFRQCGHFSLSLRNPPYAPLYAI